MKMKTIANKFNLNTETMTATLMEKIGEEWCKLAEFDCATEPAKEIDSVILADAVANFECELESQVAAGDHIVYIGRIVASHKNTDQKKRLYSLAKGHKLGPASAATT